jgi:hypothetical protein
LTLKILPTGTPTTPDNMVTIPKMKGMLPGSIGLSTSAIDLTASTRKRLPHQPRAPVQKVTQVNPKVVRIKDLLEYLWAVF